MLESVWRPRIYLAKPTRELGNICFLCIGPYEKVDFFLVVREQRKWEFL